MGWPTGRWQGIRGRDRARVLAGGPGGWVSEVGEGEGQVQFEAVFASAQWCQPNMSSRAYRGGGAGAH